MSPQVDLGKSVACYYCSDTLPSSETVGVSWHNREFCSQSCRDKWENTFTL